MALRRLPSLASAALLLSACGNRQEPAPANLAGAEGAKGPAAAAAASPPAATAAERPTPRTGPWSPSGYALVGTEPFWGGSLSGTKLRYMVPEDQFGDVIETRAAYAPDRETYSGSYKAAPFVLTLTRGPCSDGMSDRTYAFSAELSVRRETRRGCADPQ